MTAMPTFGVFAFIVDEERRVLCVRLNYAHRGWTTPGGRIEPGESVTTALKREVEEETGYTVEIGDWIGIYEKPYQHDIVLSFEARITGCGEWSPNAEIAEIAFFPQDRLPETIAPVARKRIEDGFRGCRGVFRQINPGDGR
jgi:ADP-ribose pyrophosphatase YjhB (NUDIX family)